MKYEVTIGIPVYNVEKYIRLAMDSALTQTFRSIEFLVLDDCGTDKSIDIVYEYQQTHPRGSDIRIVRQPQNMGIGNARNRIIDEAQGHYLFFLDADDTISSNAIQLLYDAAQSCNAQVVYGSHKRIELLEEKEKEALYKYSGMKFSKKDEFASWVYRCYDGIQATSWNILMDLDLLRSCNLRFEPVSYWEDFVFTINLPVYITRAVLLPDITYFYYCRIGSLSNFQKRSHIAKEEIQQTIDAMNLVKGFCCQVKQKPYFHKWLYKVMKTHFYICQTILRNKGIVSPPFTDKEISDVMHSPLNFREILGLRDWRFKNMLLFLIGLLQPSISVWLMSTIGKLKK